MQSLELAVWISYLQNLGVSAKNLDLERVRSVARHLDLLSPAVPVVTVAGTNGKGSTVALLESILTKQGYRVGCYTTPFLITFNEQFRLCQKNIDDQNLCEYFNLIEQARKNVQLTLFEFKFLAALLFFKNNTPDILILEVGLGGEHDAVNIIDPTIAVITSISLDHMDWLGDDINNIAKAKAGIFRENQQAVYGAPNPPGAIQEKATALGTTVFYLERDFNFKVNHVESCFDWESRHQKITNIPLPALFIHNAATALMAIELLQNLLPVSTRSINAGVKEAFVLGRQQIVQQCPLVIVDVAHNEASILLLRDCLLSQAKNKTIIAIFSALKTKALDEIIQPMSLLVTTWHIACLNAQRGYDVATIQKVIKKHAPHAIIHIHDDIKQSYQAAKSSLQEQDCLVAFGSFGVAGEVINVTLGQ